MMPGNQLPWWPSFWCCGLHSDMCDRLLQLAHGAVCPRSLELWMGYLIFCSPELDFCFWPDLVTDTSTNTLFYNHQGPVLHTQPSPPGCRFWVVDQAS